MTALVVPGGAGLPAGAYPELMATAVNGHTSSLSAGVFPGIGGQLYVVTHVDATCTSSTVTPQCFCDITGVLTEIVYHDSQSIGEGLGVTFAWRGFYVVPIDNPFGVTLSSVGGSCAMGIAINGFMLPTLGR